MKNIFLALTLAGFAAACSSTASVADSSADAAKSECCATTEECADMGMKAECDSAAKAECGASMGADETAKTCPVTGKTIN